MPVIFDWSGGSSAACKLIVAAVDLAGAPTRVDFELEVPAFVNNDKIIRKTTTPFHTCPDDGQAEVMLIPGPLYKVVSEAFGPGIEIPVITSGQSEVVLADVVAAAKGGYPAEAGRNIVFAKLSGFDGEASVGEHFSVSPAMLPAVTAEGQILSAEPQVKATDVGGAVWFSLARGVAHKVFSPALGEITVMPVGNGQIDLKDLLGQTV